MGETPRGVPSHERLPTTWRKRLVERPPRGGGISARAIQGDGDETPQRTVQGGAGAYGPTGAPEASIETP